MNYVGTYNSSLQAVLACKSGSEGIQVQNHTYPQTPTLSWKTGINFQINTTCYCPSQMIGASLREPHTSVTALPDACVCPVRVAIYRKFKLNGYELTYTYISNLHTC